MLRFIVKNIFTFVKKERKMTWNNFYLTLKKAFLNIQKNELVILAFHLYAGTEAFTEIV